MIIGQINTNERTKKLGLEKIIFRRMDLILSIMNSLMSQKLYHL